MHMNPRIAAALVIAKQRSMLLLTRPRHSMRGVSASMQLHASFGAREAPFRPSLTTGQHRSLTAASVDREFSQAVVGSNLLLS
jgi:hypothetical protein